ncbi:N-acetylmuramoyl-L-alanine amidase [Tumebacillus sp. DT12]|uniref:N-acetylmuramoyl-L-alanine amidase n=1 Tax=Tumebacillus lacus TaxID=2995335 RepID=A0ABT3X0I5_9BACL|nr:N-acetylmuramoyl-L-alanine amidase [Tumebacillus lacus]MCX7570421.1 N-acetylmuramoyl-L-alanine amidase [Tumebacillus lacus]
MSIPFATTAQPVIVIDPGHGGRDPGACSNGSREKDITLHISLQLRDLLTRAGFVVVMTRETDKHLGSDVSADLRERARISDAAGAIVFFSIHLNAGGGRGAEIYVHKDGGDIRPLAQSVVENVATVMGIHGTPIKSSSSVRGGGLYVVDRTEARAMLIEIGYIDSDDLQKILDHIDEFAPLIARAFCEFFGKPYRQQEPTLPVVAVNDAIKLLGTMAGVGDAEALVAFNFAANAARRAAGLPITQDLGKPAQEDAGHVCDILSKLWHLTKREDIRAVYSHMADALREATGIPK